MNTPAAHPTYQPFGVANATPRISLTRKEAADSVGISVDTLDRMIQNGDIPAYRVGKRSIRIRTEDLLTAHQPIPTTAAFLTTQPLKLT